MLFLHALGPAESSLFVVDQGSQPKIQKEFSPQGLVKRIRWVLFPSHLRVRKRLSVIGFKYVLTVPFGSVLSPADEPAWESAALLGF